MRGQVTPWDGRPPDDTGWINLQLVNSWVGFDSGLSLGGTGRACQVRRIHGVVHFQGVMRSGVSPIFCTLPVGFRPAVTTIYEYCCIAAINASWANVLINASTGQMEVPISAASQSYTYLAGLQPFVAGS